MLVRTKPRTSLVETLVAGSQTKIYPRPIHLPPRCDETPKNNNLGVLITKFSRTAYIQIHLQILKIYTIEILNIQNPYLKHMINKSIFSFNTGIFKSNLKCVLS